MKKLGKKLLACAMTAAFACSSLCITAMAALPSYTQEFGATDEGNPEADHYYEKDWRLNPNNISSEPSKNSNTVADGKVTVKKANARATSVTYTVPSGTTYKEAVEVMFDVKWNEMPDSAAWVTTWTNIMAPGSVSLAALRFDRNTKTEGKISMGSGGTYKINDVTVGNTYRYKVNLDMNEKSWTVAYAEVKDGAAGDFTDVGNTMYWTDDKDSVGMVQFAGSTYVPLEYSIDNFSIRQMRGAALKLTSHNVKATGVELYPIFKLNFNDNIDVSTMEGIKLCKGDAQGAEVAATVKAEGNSITVSPNAKLDAKTQYTIVLPDTLVSTQNGLFAGQNIEFYTGNAINGGATDFNIPVTTDSATIVASLKNKNLFFDYRNNNATENVAEITADGKLHIKAVGPTASYLMIPLQNGDFKNSKYVKVDFDFKLGEYEKDSIQWFIRFRDLYKDAQTIVRMDRYHNQLSVYKRDNTVLQAFEADEWKHYTVLFDFVNGTATFKIDGLKDDITVTDMIHDYGLRDFHMTLANSNMTTSEFWMDNFSMYELEAPEAACSAPATNASFKDDINVTFNTAMNTDTDIKLLDSTGNEVSSAIGSWSADGYTYTFALTDELAPETAYKISVPALTTANGLSFSACEYGFETMAIPPEIKIEPSVQGNIEAGASISATAKYSNTGGKAGDSVYLAIAFYDKDGVMLNVAAGSANLDTNKSATETLEFVAPNDLETGAYFKFFAWDANSLKPLLESVKYPNN